MLNSVHWVTLRSSMPHAYKCPKQCFGGKDYIAPIHIDMRQGLSFFNVFLAI